MDLEELKAEVKTILTHGRELMEGGEENANSFPSISYFHRIFGWNITSIAENSESLAESVNEQAIIEIISEARTNRFAFAYLLSLDEKYPGLSNELSKFVRDVANQRTSMPQKNRGRNPDKLMMRNYVICDAVRRGVSAGLPAYSTDNLKSVTACSIVDECLKEEFKIFVNVIQLWKDRTAR
jgi:hypothetical protein|tara:strand:+ start:9412 stop:9957 length:546 start_codon:yes stop_codon:yes gene_type:complete